MKNISFLILAAHLFIVTLNSCGIDTGVEIRSSQDSLKIPNQEYKLFRFITTLDGKEYFSLYNSTLHSIHLFDWETKKQIKNIKLPGDTIDIGKLNDYSFVSWDTVILQYTYKIAIIDTASNVKFSHYINEPLSDSFPDVMRNNYTFSFPMIFSPDNLTLTIRQYSGKYLSSERPFYNVPICSLFKLSNQTFSDIPVTWPANYKREYYGDAINVSQTNNGELYVFSFPANDSLFVYDKKMLKFRAYACKSRFKVHDNIPLDLKYSDDINKKVDHLSVSPLYEKILYDKYRNLYYRFFLTAVPIRNPDGTYNTSADKKLSLMIIDQNFNTLDEILLPNHEWHYSFVTKKGLCLEKIDNKAKMNLAPTKLVRYEILTFNKH